MCIACIKNIENNVDILSNINEKRKKSLFKDSHIFCLPSISKAEAYGLVLLEALSYGIPLITFKMPESGTNFINKNNRKTPKTASTKGGDAAVTLITEICKLLPFSR